MIENPKYLDAVYGWLYNSKKWSNFFDSKKLRWLLTLGHSTILEDALNKEIRPGADVLQVGITFGDQIAKTSASAGALGSFIVADVNMLQVQLAEEKHNAVRFINKDAAKDLGKTQYDVVVCYMLLHELPIMTKTKVMNNILSCVKEGGKAVFIDYHKPEPYHPLRYLARMFNRLYQPFAEKLWDREIHSFATKSKGFTWRKTTYFWRMYQKVVAIRVQTEE